MLRIILRGCNGRMGQAISSICRDRVDLTIVAGVDIDTRKLFDYPIYADPIEFRGQADVVIDFSRPDNVDEILDYCFRQSLPLVLATTGLSETKQLMVDVAAQKIAVFQSGNMSLGIHVLSSLVARAAAVLGEDFNIEIIERHHNQKLDAPSGTAYMLYNAAKDALPYEASPVYDRHERREKRPPHEIGLHALRGGTIVGEHEVVFAGRDEVITLSHSAQSREVFAAGAVRAAQFIAGKAPGLYNMSQLVAESTDLL